MKERLHDCARAASDPLYTCKHQQLFADLTGNLGAPQPSGVAISASFRTALYHHQEG